MATTPPPFRTTPPPTPPRIAPAVAASPPRPTPPPPARRVSPPPPTTPPRANESGADTVAAVLAPTSGAELVVAAEMDPAADIATGEQQAVTRSRVEAPAFTPRPKYGQPARTLSKAQLRRGLRSICTECKRSQTVSSNVSMCPSSCRRIQCGANPSAWGHCRCLGGNSARRLCCGLYC